MPWTKKMSLTMDDLAAFLAARYDEAEARERKMLETLAKAGPDACLAVCFDDGTSSNAIDYNPWDAITDYDPAHRLVGIKLKRAILERYKDQHWHAPALPNSPFPEQQTEDVGACRTCVTMKLLGTEFGDHPDYKPGWRPDDTAAAAP